MTTPEQIKTIQVKMAKAAGALKKFRLSVDTEVHFIREYEVEALDEKMAMELYLGGKAEYVDNTWTSQSLSSARLIVSKRSPQGEKK